MNTLTLNLNQKNLKPNEQVKGNITWFLDKIPKDLEIRLFWHTQGRGTEDLKIIDKVNITPALQGEYSFTFTLPQGPYSFSGKLISLIWAIEFVANPSDDCARKDITLSPTGQEIQL